MYYFQEEDSDFWEVSPVTPIDDRRNVFPRGSDGGGNHELKHSYRRLNSVHVRINLNPVAIRTREIQLFMIITNIRHFDLILKVGCLPHSVICYR